MSDRVVLHGPVDETTVYLPIAVGLRPVALEGRLVVAPDVVSGVLEIYVHDRLLWAKRLQPGDAPDEVRVPLPEAIQVPDARFLPVSFRVRLQGEEPDFMCNPRSVGAWVRWQDGQLRLREAADRTMPSIAAFFRPGALQWLLVLPDDVSVGEAETALQWTTLLRTTQGGRIEVQVLPQRQLTAWVEQHPLPSPWLRRTVFLEVADTATTVLQYDAFLGPTLYLRGTARDLSSWTQLLRQRWAQALPLRQTGSVVFQAPREVEAERIPLSTWGQPLYIEGYGRLTLRFPFTQSDLGTEIKTAGVRLVGRYTPLPQGYLALLSVWFNGALLQHLPLTSKGALDLFVEFPSSLLQRENEFKVVVEYTTPERCVENLPFQLWLDPRSFIWFKAGPTPNGRGLQRFPQVFYPELGVVLEPMTWPHLQAAALLLDVMQRTTWRPLHPRLLSRDQAWGTSLPLLVVGREITAWAPQVALQPLRFQVEGRGSLEVTTDEDVALLLPLTHGGTSRPVLALFAGRDSDALQLVQGLQEHSDGWFGIKGDVVLYAAPDRWTELVGLQPLRSGESLPSSLRQWWHQYRALIGLTALVVAAIGLTWLYQRWVRVQPTLSSQVTPIADDTPPSIPEDPVS